MVRLVDEDALLLLPAEVRDVRRGAEPIQNAALQVRGVETVPDRRRLSLDLAVAALAGMAQPVLDPQRAVVHPSRRDLL